MLVATIKKPTILVLLSHTKSNGAGTSANISRHTNISIVFLNLQIYSRKQDLTF